MEKQAQFIAVKVAQNVSTVYNIKIPFEIHRKNFVCFLFKFLFFCIDFWTLELVIYKNEIFNVLEFFKN